MPIYAYRCSDCGHTQDVLQKMSEAPLTECPRCGHPTFARQLTAPAFQLKGSGWYVTDFRDNGKKPPAEGAGGEQGKTSDAATGAAASPSAASSPGAAPPAASPAPAASSPAPSPKSGTPSTGAS